MYVGYGHHHPAEEALHLEPAGINWTWRRDRREAERVIRGNLVCGRRHPQRDVSCSFYRMVCAALWYHIPSSHSGMLCCAPGMCGSSSLIDAWLRGEIISPASSSDRYLFIYSGVIKSFFFSRLFVICYFVVRWVRCGGQATVQVYYW